MIHVYRDLTRPAAATIREYSEKISSATAHEASGRKGAMSSRIKPVGSGMKVCGPAYTVLTRSKDNLMVHKALATAHPGDVLVVAVEGSPEAGYWGELMTVSAMARGIAGVVIDGCVRDIDEIRRRSFPVFSRGASIRGTTKKALGLVNHPVVVGEILIHPGDLILGDDDGVVAIAQNCLHQVLQKSIERIKDEQAIIAGLTRGVTTLEMGSLDTILADLGMVEE